MTNTHYYDGQWLPADKLTISVFDLSVLRGFGVFDFFRTYNRKPFRVEDNIARFRRSAEILELTVPLSDQELTDIVNEGIKRNPNGEIGIRLILTGGTSPDMITPGKPKLVALFTAAHDLPARYFKDGVKIITWPMPRVYAEAKSLNYLPAVKAKQHAARLDAIEALYTDSDGIKRARVYEATTSNFFAVIDGELHTTSEGILFGITRKVVLELADKAGIKVRQRELLVSEIPAFDEAFLTAANKQVLPVVTIDDHTIGSGQPGPVTRQLMAAFADYTANY